MLKLTPVQSSLLVAIGWDSTTNELVIEFPRGARYAYFGEHARKHYDAMMSRETESVGKYFLANIKNKPEVPFRRIEDNPEKSMDKPGPKEKGPADPPLLKNATPGVLREPDDLKQLF